MQRRPAIDPRVRAERHVRAPVPLAFPSGAMVPESKRHLELRTLLYAILKRRFAGEARIGSDQFVYFRASDPKKCVAPDAFVRRGAPDEDFASWKVWERGAPELAVEIVSESDRPWEEKLADYHEIGVIELVRFDADAPEKQTLRVWDRIDGDLVERVIDSGRTPSGVLGGAWVVRPGAGYPAALRLEDERGQLLLSPEERVVELEAELAKRRG
jgi:Uma2 family endonuclease